MTPRNRAVSNVVRSGKRALAVALLGLMLGAFVTPATSSAASLRSGIAPAPHPIVHPTDGVGDSPLVP
jgi:hypothetical protein